MTQSKHLSADSIQGYHAHIYYRNDAEKQQAAMIRESVGEHFDVTLGRWRDEPVGPHPEPMYQISFAREDLGQMLPWLMSMRGELSILVHASSGIDDYLDHTAGACWLGTQLNLKLDIFKHK